MTTTATKRNVKRRSLTELASNPDLIPGIYNYCDRWCEKCPLTSRCLVYATEQEEGVSLERLEAENEEFWNRLSTIYREAREVIVGWAREAGLDFTQPAFEEKGGRRQRRRTVDNHLLVKAAKKYANTAGDWFRDLPEGENAQQKWGEAGLEATDVVQWYQYQIAVKTMRALSERWDGDEDEGVPKDSDGAAKVALIGIERSIGAWHWLQTIIPAQAASIVPLILQLERLRVEVEREFPGAVVFVRPGFDEVPAQAN